MAGRSHFDNPAQREWWSVHVEAWRRSGLSRKKYCCVHKRTDKTFARWIAALTDAKMAKIHAERAACEPRQKRSRKGVKLTTDRRNCAAQAYWAMHVEALEWSGMTVREYAAALAISRHSLARWRDLLAERDAPVDWRARLHPSARPQISSAASPRTSSGLSPHFMPREAGLGLTGGTSAEPQQERQAQRRSFSDDEKRAIVMQTLDPHVTVSQAARRHGIAAALLF
ncbi:MAG: IS66 family insertion sequence element accessory protein TnpA [Agrobacterium tumefaciens]